MQIYSYSDVNSVHTYILSPATSHDWNMDSHILMYTCDVYVCIASYIYVDNKDIQVDACVLVCMYVCVSHVYMYI